MNPQEVVEVIRQIVAMLEPPAQEVWRIAMGKVQLDAIGHFVAALIMLMVVIGFVFLARYSRRRDSEERDANPRDKDGWSNYDGEWLIGAGVGIVLAVCCFAVVVAEIMSGVYRLVLPEWYAIQILLGLVN